MNPLKQFGIQLDTYSHNLNIHIIATRLVDKLKSQCTRIILAGSIRRGVHPSDIDIVCIPKNKENIKTIIQVMGGKIWSQGSEQIYFKYQGVNVNLYYATPDTWGAQLMTRTGPRGGNIGNRTLAKKQGMTLNQYGLYKGKKLIAGKTEQSIYTALGKKYKEPTERGK